MQLFNFTLPIGWEEAATIFTMLTVVVAIFANIHSNSSLKKTLQMHRQTKDMNLLKDRIKIVEKIEKDRPISFTKLELLFEIEDSSDIKNVIQKYRIASQKIIEYERDETNFWIMLNNMEEEGNEPTKYQLQIMGYHLMLLKRQNKPYEDYAKMFKAFCDKHIAIATLEDQAINIQSNYYDVFTNLYDAKAEYDKSKNYLCKWLKGFIAASMKTIQ